MYNFYRTRNKRRLSSVVRSPDQGFCQWYGSFRIFLWYLLEDYWKFLKFTIWILYIENLWSMTKCIWCKYTYSLFTPIRSMQSHSMLHRRCWLQSYPNELHRLHEYHSKHFQSDLSRSSSHLHSMFQTSTSTSLQGVQRNNNWWILFDFIICQFT